MSLDVGMLDLYVLGAPLLASLFLALLAAVSYIWYKRKKESLVYFSVPGCGDQEQGCMAIVIGQS